MDLKQRVYEANLELAKIIAESQEKLARSIEQKDGGKAAGEIAEALAKVMEANAENAKKNNIELARLISASAANVQAGEKGDSGLRRRSGAGTGCHLCCRGEERSACCPRSGKPASAGTEGGAGCSFASPGAGCAGVCPV